MKITRQIREDAIQILDVAASSTWILPTSVISRRMGHRPGRPAERLARRARLVVHEDHWYPDYQMAAAEAAQRLREGWTPRGLEE